MAPKHSAEVDSSVPNVPHRENTSVRQASLRHELKVLSALTPQLVNEQYILNKLFQCKHMKSGSLLICWLTAHRYLTLDFLQEPWVQYSLIWCSQRLYRTQPPQTMRIKCTRYSIITKQDPLLEQICQSSVTSHTLTSACARLATLRSSDFRTCGQAGTSKFRLFTVPD